MSGSWLCSSFFMNEVFSSQVRLLKMTCPLTREEWRDGPAVYFPPCRDRNRSSIAVPDPVWSSGLSVVSASGRGRSCVFSGFLVSDPSFLAPLQGCKGMQGGSSLCVCMFWACVSFFSFVYLWVCAIFNLKMRCNDKMSSSEASSLCTPHPVKTVCLIYTQIVQVTFRWGVANPWHCGWVFRLKTSLLLNILYVQMKHTLK